MDELNKIEELRKQAASFSVPTSDKLWDGIAASIKKRKRIKFLYFFIPSALLVFVAGYWLLNTAISKPGNISEKNNLNETVITELSLFKKENQIKDSLKEAFSSGRLSRQQNEKFDSIKNELKDIDISKSKTKNKEFTKNNLRLKAKKSSPNLRRNIKTIQLKTSDKEDKKDRVLLIEDKSIKNFVGDKLVLSQKMEVDSSINEKAIVSIKNTKNNDLEQLSSSKSDSVNLVKDNQKLDEMNSLKEIEDSAKKEQELLENNKVETLPKQESKIKTKRFSSLAAGGIGYSNRFLSGENNELLINHKNKNEQGAIAYNFSLVGQYDFGKSFVRLGLIYAYYSEKYSFANSVISHSTSNSYEYFQLPISYGRKILENSKFSASIEAGVKLSSLNLAQSSWVDPQVFEAVSHTSNDPQQPFNKNPITYFGAIDIKYQLNNKFGLHIMPTFDSFISSVYQNSSALNQRQYSILLRFGSSYRF